MKLPLAFLTCFVVAGITSGSNAGPVPVAEPMKWRDLPAYRLTDGHSEAIVVPSLGGRVLHFGLIGGLNWLWNGESGAERKKPAVYWGGDKTYLGPHTFWALTQDAMWPPPPPDSEPCEVVAPQGLFSTLGVPWPGSGVRIRRDYSFGKTGELVITHSIAPAPGSREVAALWVIAQTIPTEAVFVPLPERSPYKDGYFLFDFTNPAAPSWAAQPLTGLLRLKPEPGVKFKIGANPARPALATVKGRLAFLQRADPQQGMYPEGTPEAGLSVEVYHHDQIGTGQYVELEQLSPLRRLDQGITLTTRWSIHPIPELPLKEELQWMRTLLKQ